MAGSTVPTGRGAELTVEATTAQVALAGARYVADQARQAVSARGSFTLAVSGGRTPWEMFAHLLSEDMPWQDTHIFQVDERCVPDDDPARNLTQLLTALSGAPAFVHPMPVTEPDLASGAEVYGSALPDHIDLIHLGLGADGHTASLVPGDGVLSIDRQPVACTSGEYQGTRRMTLTYPGLARARRFLWLVTGAEKADALRRLRSGDLAIPAGRVYGAPSVIVADSAAADGTVTVS